MRQIQYAAEYRGRVRGVRRGGADTPAAQRIERQDRSTAPLKRARRGARAGVLAPHQSQRKHIFAQRR